MSQPAPIIIAGPTAGGKSEIAFELARRLRGEIISVDSMQVYRGMDIGTAKPSAGEQQAVPHHLLDIVDVVEPFDAARFARLANAAIKDIQARNHRPILVGGTGLYFKAIIDGVGRAPPASSALRRELEATPPQQLLAELEQKDPAAFARIDKKNPRRVLRALEVIRQTGRPFSEQQSPWPAPSEKQTAAPAFVLSRSADDLRHRIETRVDEMFKRGLVDETRALMAAGLALNQTAMQAIGYRQVAEYLQGTLSLPQTIELVKIRTRQYAKRQLTWFRRHLQAEWIHLPPQTPPADVCEVIIKRVTGPAA